MQSRIQRPALLQIPICQNYHLIHSDQTESVLSGNINQARIWMNGFFFKPLDIEACGKESEQRYT